MLVFITIFGMGAVLLVFNLIFGHDADSDLGVGEELDGPEGPSIFSARMISLILIGFGAVGFGVRTTTDASMAMSSIAGIVGSLVMGVSGYFILRAFYSTQASSTVTDREVVGSTGQLTDAIPEDGVGRISCVLRGRAVTFLARSEGRQPISRGAQVRVVSKFGSTVTVKEVE